MAEWTRSLLSSFSRLDGLPPGEPVAAAVRKHGAPDRGVGGADWIGRRSGEANRSKEGGGGELYEKSVEMRHLRVLAFPEEPGLAPSWATGVVRDGRMRKMARIEAVGCIIGLGQHRKMEILA